MSDIDNHPDEEQLVLHLLGDDEDRTAVAPHVESCARCRSHVERLRGILAASTRPVPEPDAGFEARIWERQRRALVEAGALPERDERAGGVVIAGRFGGMRRVLAGGAIAASLLAAFLLGQYTGPAGAPTAPDAVAGGAPATGRSDRVLLVAVGGHLERARIVLLEIANASGPADLLAQRGQARDLLADNRLYRQTASIAGRPAMADVLDEVERVLLELAESPDTTGSEELEWLRARIADRDLLFKVKVIEGSARGGTGIPRAAGRDL